MIALLLTDIHGRTHVLEKILASAGSFDIILVSGDLTDFGDSKKALEVVEALKKPGKPVFAIPGNCDPKEVLEVMEKEGVSIHGKHTSFGGFVFAGFGGSNSTPFDTPFEMPEGALGVGLGSACGGIKHQILLTHAPPKNSVFDLLPNGAHAGSEAVRTAIHTHEPAFLFCGHIHEGVGIGFVEKTLVANPGPALAGHWGIADLISKKVALKSLGGGV